jgi:hypothetical protein
MDPRRLIDDGADAFERRLLAAGRRDALPVSRRAQILVSLGLSSVVPGTAMAAASAKGAAKGGLFALVSGATAKVAIGGAVGAVAIWSFLTLTPRPPPPPPAEPVAQRVVERLPQASRALSSEQAAVTPQLDVLEEPLPSEPSKRRVTAAHDDGADLAREFEELDQARIALRAGDSRRALRLLEQHGERFPKQRLRAEATVLRIEALSVSGDRATAKRLGEDFLERNPRGPYAQRVSSLIQSTADSR